METGSKKTKIVVFKRFYDDECDAEVFLWNEQRASKGAKFKEFCGYGMDREEMVKLPRTLGESYEIVSAEIEEEED